MKRVIWQLTALLLGLVLLPIVHAVPARADDIVTIAHSTWVGYGPLYIARDKGIFKKNGVDVDLVVMEDPKERFPTLMADRI
ncbi:MAG: ABC transporter substrate-binding protein, partial [Acetobacteraceae bacterium]